VLLLALVLFVPALETLFVVEKMNGMQLGCVGVMAVLPTFVIQSFKVAREIFDREK
jgi:Ca2+-transporting ATPase